MRFWWRLAAAGLVRQPVRTLTRVVVLAVAVALLGGILLFVANTLRTASATALRTVPLDLQGQVPSARLAERVAAAVAHQRGVVEAAPVATAPFSSAEHRGASGATAAGHGSVLAVAPGYLDHIKTFHLLYGALRPDAVVLDQQLAATLQAHLGDRVTLRVRPGAPARGFLVSGIASVNAGDTLFQPLDPRLGPAPAQPPANVALLSFATFAKRVAPDLRAAAASSPTAADAVPGAQTGVQWQVHVQLDPRPLTAGSPSRALTLAQQATHRIERSLPGQVQFVDNLSTALNIAAGDALYAQALYIMLAVPGALIALGLAYLAALGTVERDRRTLAQLRSRGATRGNLLGLAMIESLLVGVLAGGLGALMALASVSLLVPGGAQAGSGRVIVTFGACMALAVAGAAAARLGASFRAAMSPVAAGRRTAQRQRPPLWQRLYLDLVALAGSGLVYWLTSKTGFSAVVNPDSNPTLSLSIYMFFGPALLWIGATLLLVRLRGRALAWVVGRAAGHRPRGLGGFVLASASRRGAAINRGLVLVGLLLAFGVQLSIFSATYHQQARVDAQLTVGADVVATAAPGHALAARVATVSGVRAVSAVDHSYAYVGPDLQDIFGIDPATLPKATALRDYYFKGQSAQQAMERLQRDPTGVLVSKETIADYGLNIGDLLRLRVLDRSRGRFRVVPFHVAGIVQEFPSAPKDSFMVANLPYLSSVDHAGGPNVVFAAVPHDPAGAAARVSIATRSLGAKVDDIHAQTARTVSSITTVDLSGIASIEEAFAVALAAAAIGLFVALGLAERRAELATMAAVGAPLREVAVFLWSEAGLVLAFSIVLAAGLGLLLAMMLVAILTHVFDPPPDTLAIPWSYLGTLAGAAVASALAATALAARGLRQLSLGAVLREQ